ncbi:MAG: DUF1667 domain-containing protein [Cellulosilyticaceae bacterium]
MTRELICIVCPKGCRLTVTLGDEVKVSGNSCPRGEVYGRKEVTAPTRVLTTTVKIEGASHRRLPVKTSKDIPKDKIEACMAEINEIKVKAPIKMHTILIENVADTGADIIATRDLG